MKNLLKPLALASILAVGSAGTAMAWPGPNDGGAGDASTSAPARAGHHGRAGRGLMRMAGRLELTDAQKAQMRQILADARAQRTEARESFSQLSPEARREAMRAQRASVKEALMAVLTDAQKAKLAELRSARATARGGGEGGSGSAVTPGSRSSRYLYNSTREPRRPTDMETPRGFGHHYAGPPANQRGHRGAAAGDNGRGHGPGPGAGVGETAGPRSN